MSKLFVDEIQPKTTGGAVSMTGHVLQVVNFQTAEVDTTTAQLPFDDSRPLISEGKEVMTLAITPTSASSKLRIEVHTFTQYAATGHTVIALFQDNITHSLAATASYRTANWGQNSSFSHYMTAGTTSETTFRVRIGRGGSSASTITFNGEGGTRDLGGVMSSSITITEIGA